MGLNEKELNQLITRVKKTMKPGWGCIPDEKLRNSLVPEYGLDGLRILMACEHPGWNVTLVPVQESGSPWANAGSNIESMIEAGLGPLVKRLPRTVKMLSQAVLVCAGLHSADPKAKGVDREGWFLVYSITHPEYGPRCWIAGPPRPHMSGPSEDWDPLPQPLIDIYSRHDGFGVLLDEFGWTGCDPGVMPACCIRSPNLFMKLSGMDASKLLRFTRGTGPAGEGGWCFSRLSEHQSGLSSAGLPVVEYEDEMETCGDIQPFNFWEFLDRYLTGDDDELVCAEVF